jgi:hypothetical protein
MLHYVLEVSGQVQPGEPDDFDAKALNGVLSPAVNPELGGTSMKAVPIDLNRDAMSRPVRIEQ